MLICRQLRRPAMTLRRVVVTWLKPLEPWEITWLVMVRRRRPVLLLVDSVALARSSTMGAPRMPTLEMKVSPSPVSMLSR